MINRVHLTHDPTAWRRAGAAEVCPITRSRINPASEVPNRCTLSGFFLATPQHVGGKRASADAEIPPLPTVRSQVDHSIPIGRAVERRLSPTHF